MDSQMPDGANLRDTKLERGDVIVAIKCGRPGRSMPAFDKLAYSDARCYGMKRADLKSNGLSLPDRGHAAAARDRIARRLPVREDHRQRRDERARCIEYWGAEVEACGEFPN